MVSFVLHRNLSSKYDAADAQKIADSCIHLTEDQLEDLAKLLAKFPCLFNGLLCKFIYELIHLHVDPSVPPSRLSAYTVPHSH